MKVLRVLPTLDPAYGGPVTGMISSAHEMAKQGWQTEILTLDRPDAPWLQQGDWAATGVGPGVSKIGYTPRLGRWIAGNADRFDVAVVHGVWTWASVGAGRALRHKGVPYLLFTHGMMDPYFFAKRPVNRLMKHMFWQAQGPVLQGATNVLFTADAEADAAQKAFPRPSFKARVVSYGAAGPSERSALWKFKTREALGVPENARYVLFMGRFDPKKGIGLLVEAFAKSCAVQQDLHLVIAGPDPMRLGHALRSLAKQHGLQDRVHFPGMLSGELKWEALSGAELFALPTQQENFGLALIEAMASGTPVLTTYGCNIHKQLNKGGGAIICAPTGAEIAKALQTFYALPKTTRQAMAQAALTTYKVHFTAQKASQDLMTVLNSAVAASKAAA